VHAFFTASERYERPHGAYSQGQPQYPHKEEGCSPLKGWSNDTSKHDFCRPQGKFLNHKLSIDFSADQPTLSNGRFPVHASQSPKGACLNFSSTSLAEFESIASADGTPTPLLRWTGQLAFAAAQKHSMLQDNKSRISPIRASRFLF
jgi:hypothetical protein